MNALPPRARVAAAGETPTGSDGGRDARRVRTTCPYCGVGCGVVASVGAAASGERPVPETIAIAGDPQHPANLGRLCSKGSALADVLGQEGRLLHPQVDGRRTDWDGALDRVASGFREAIAAHGPDSVAFYLSGQLLTEDYYLANKLMKGFIGSANVDTNSRLCMASTVAGQKRAFGSDTVPGSYEDLELADLVVVTGANLAWCHPVLFQRIQAARRRRPGMRLVVIDPRRTATADEADLHLAIASDGDTALFNGLLHHLIATGAVDRTYVERHTTGFADAEAAVAGADLAATAAATGLASARLQDFFRAFAGTERVVTLFSQGVNQSEAGTDKVNAILNAHLATGRIGRPGMGPFSLTGQPNAMGGREVGGLANQLAAHMEIEDPRHRALVGQFWDAPAMARKPGLRAVELFQAVAAGRIKALWIMATNPVASLPDNAAVEAALAACPFVVVSDVTAATDTARHADVLLPAAAWGEKDGTVTNSERRISRQRAFLPLPGEARPDWWIIAQVARRMGWARAFDHDGPAAIYREHAALSAWRNGGSRDFDIGVHAGLSDAAYDGLQPVQWPLPAEGGGGGTGRLFGNGAFHTPDGRARFLALAPPDPAPATPARPVLLNTGRIRDQWHTMTRTALSARLSAHYAEPFAELHPETARQHGIGPADLVAIESAHGRILVRALVTARQQPGMAFVPMHWNDQTSAAGRVGRLLAPRIDPVSGQPALKRMPVALHRFPAAWYAFAVSVDRPDPGGLPDLPYWALARCRRGWRLELAGDRPAGDPASVAATLLGTAGDGEQVYADAAGGSFRLARFAGDRLVASLHLARRPVAVSRAWLAGMLDREMPASQDRMALLAGRPGSDRPDPGATVCACFDVGANTILQAVGRGCTTVDAIGASLGAGSNCGSCRAEIGELIRHAGS